MKSNRSCRSELQHEQLRHSTRISRLQKNRPAGKRDPDGVRPHEIRAAGAHQPGGKRGQSRGAESSSPPPTARPPRPSPTPRPRPRAFEAEGEAEAAKALPVFQQNPELANFLLRIDALQQSLNQRSTLIFDERTPPFDLFQQSADQCAGPVTMSDEHEHDHQHEHPAPAPVTPETPVRRRWPRRCAAVLRLSKSSCC